MIKSLTRFTALLGGSALLTLSAPTSLAQMLPDALPSGTYIELSNDHTLGKKNAPATMIVYASVTCPHCAAWFADTWPSLKAEYIETGKLRFVFREFPTAPAQLATAGFVLAGCADEDDYFENIEYQMASQDFLTLLIQDTTLTDPERIERFLNDRAEKAGLSSRQQKRCLAQQDGFEKINQSIAQARAAKISSVPGFVLNGRLIPSKDGTYEGLSTAIDAVIIGK